MHVSNLYGWIDNDNTDSLASRFIGIDCLINHYGFCLHTVYRVFLLLTLCPKLAPSGEDKPKLWSTAEYRSVKTTPPLKRFG